MFYAIFVPTTKVFRETKEFFNFEIRKENYVRIAKKKNNSNERPSKNRFIMLFW